MPPATFTWPTTAIMRSKKYRPAVTRRIALKRSAADSTNRRRCGRPCRERLRRRLRQRGGEKDSSGMHQCHVRRRSLAAVSTIHAESRWTYRGLSSWPTLSITRSNPCPHRASRLVASPRAIPAPQLQGADEHRRRRSRQRCTSPSRSAASFSEVPAGCNAASCVVTIGGGFNLPYGVGADWQRTCSSPIRQQRDKADSAGLHGRRLRHDLRYRLQHADSASGSSKKAAVRHFGRSVDAPARRLGAWETFALPHLPCLLALPPALEAAFCPALPATARPAGAGQPLVPMRTAFRWRCTSSSAARIATAKVGGRGPKFVSPSTNGLAVAVYPHGAAHTLANLIASAVVDVSSGSPACGKHVGFPRTCTAT